MKVRQCNFPFYRGSITGAIHSATPPGSVSPTPYNRCKMTLLNWYTPAFAGWRGSTRWKIHGSGNVYQGNGPAVNKGYMKVRRVATEIFTYNESVPTWEDFGTPNEISSTNMFSKDSTIDGGFVTSEDGNGALEYELPYQEQLRFFPARVENQTLNFNFTSFHDFETVTGSSGFDGTCFDRYCAAGEDFSLFFFAGVPRVFYIGFGDPPP